LLLRRRALLLLLLLTRGGGLLSRAQRLLTLGLALRLLLLTQRDALALRVLLLGHARRASVRLRRGLPRGLLLLLSLRALLLSRGALLFGGGALLLALLSL
jgi:hypothetical protein